MDPVWNIDGEHRMQPKKESVEKIQKGDNMLNIYGLGSRVNYFSVALIILSYCSLAYKLS